MAISGVRRAGPQDAQSLCKLLTEYFEEGDVDQMETEQTVLSLMETPQLRFYLVGVEGNLAGCVLCRPLPDKERSAECRRLYVRPEFRGLGLATLLMDTIEAEAQTNGFAWMYLDSKNNFGQAIAIYQRRGYVACQRFNDNPQATFFFRKSLTA